MSPSAPRRAALDLGIVIIVFLMASAALPRLDPVLRRGHGLQGALALAAYQFACEGIAVVGILLARREALRDYGIRRRNLGRSLAFALVLSLAYDAVLSWHAREFLWLPFARHTATRMSLQSDLVGAAAGIALMVLVWGGVESFVGVFVARKVNIMVGHAGRGWLSPGALAFGLLNGLIHFAIGQGLSGFMTSFGSGYVIATIPAVTDNAWGSALFQALTNAVGHP